MNWDWFYTFLLRFGLPKEALTTLTPGQSDFGWTESLQSFAWIEADGSVIWRLAKGHGIPKERMPHLAGEEFVLTAVNEREERYTCLPNWNLFETARDLAAFYLSGFAEAFAFADKICRLPKAYFTAATAHINNSSLPDQNTTFALVKESSGATSALIENTLGKILVQQGDVSAAAKCFGKAAQSVPEFAEPYSNLGALLWQNGEREKAFELFGEALLRDPMDVSVQDNFIQAGLNLGAMTTLSQRLDEVGKLYPAYYGLDNLRAQIAWQLNNADEAKKYIGRILIQNPRDAMALALQSEITQSEASGDRA